ncbi:hypothetical protein B1C78_10385 [Thioalkalivibrio denitrificans]|uniref:MarR family transcriptional regulator n=1 Tax=Thioalkalivibrio denitrificans TaxID=108003 RepID=A0A1V3NF82_9GAMM|nr:DUF488 domain-containing protein [Thioalkalivibrio denitrificans]OOG23685.1 hypothetical protein B1C78_10385 [Thioalkalivibrio denitrificans]
MTVRIALRRIYAAPEADDGLRVLVDRLWPRGVRKADAKVGLWLREIAPSHELRRWFGHDPGRWMAFRDRYRDELARQPQRLRELMDHCRRGPVTLLYAARDETRNHAVVLREVLLGEFIEEARPNEASSPVCYLGAGDAHDS